jgi:hypothetical protein
MTNHFARFGPYDQAAAPAARRPAVSGNITSVIGLEPPRAVSPRRGANQL